MDAVHVHLLLNHVPIIGSIFALALMLYGAFLKNSTVLNTGLVTMAVVALFAIPVFLSGDEAEDIVEKIPGISEYYLEEHEELSEVAIWFISAAGILSLISLILTKFKSPMKTLNYLSILLTAVAFTFMVFVGNHGGKIRHSEILDSTLQQVDSQGDAEEDEDEDE